MPSFIRDEGIVTKELHIFYLLDVSGSMKGTAIAQLNQGIRSTMDALRQKLGDSNDAHLSISIMRFSTEAAWITGTPESRFSEYIEDFVDIPDLEAGGMTYLGRALRLLESGLSRNSMLYSPTGNRRPIIIVMTDGLPNDDWQSAMKSIKNNHWFQQSTKIGIALGDQADEDMLAELVGSREGVVRVTDISLFAQMLVNVSVTSSLANSNSIISQAEPGAGAPSVPGAQPSVPKPSYVTPPPSAPIEGGKSMPGTILPSQVSVTVKDPFDDQGLE